MSNIPDSLKYAESHEWLKIDGDLGTVGITDHAQHELTDVVYVELPKAGAVVAKGSPVAVIESVKAASDIYSPVSGEIVEVNASLPDNPADVNADPYGKGWIFKIKLSNPAEAETLKSAGDYQTQIGA
ncbi:glycine cleavage system protein GcvH [Oscillatoria laete-virens NRMC-F 0139]|nr:glycine cleavage system protein GcvH [Oscillatoria laete-virens]MDL5054476.1 glycine cleavage system protein GcvH [Oscillatoria laete-virens NRMC-F 0139]